MDIAVAALLAVGIGFAAIRISGGLHYNWSWEVLPQYFIKTDPDTGRLAPNLLLQGFFTTIRLSFWGTLIALFAGCLAGLMRTAKRRFARLLGATYVEVLRNIPPLVLVFIFYYFISEQILPTMGAERFINGLSDTSRCMVGIFFSPASRFSAFMAGAITLGIIEGAYIAEIVRSGIESISRGQWEASSALGLTRFQQMVHVILPQAFRRILPPLAGQFISTIKDSAIVSVISVPELTFQGMELMAATYMTFEVWIAITIMYLLLTFSCSYVVGRMEKKMHHTGFQRGS